MATQVVDLKKEITAAVKEIADSSTTADVKAAFAGIKVLKVREVKVVSSGKQALIVVVPYKSFVNYIKPNHARCVIELEKKTKRHVCYLAMRDVMNRSSKRPGQRIRPFTRTLTSVHNEMLKDILGSVEIAGRRIVITQDGKKIHKILIDPKEKGTENVEEKLATFTAVYQTLTSKHTVFEFADYTL